MPHLPSRFPLLLLAVLLALPASVRADDFVAMPGAKGAQKDLKLKLVKYDGSTNGVMVVEVKNTGKSNVDFEALGLFFVPEGDPKDAPQRLGASGPFTEIAKGGKTVHEEKVGLSAGETKTLQLEVFCIGSHRSSPSSATRFAIAKNKLPKDLQRDMKSSNQAIYKRHKGDIHMAKPAVQESMWENRDKKWIKLEGERANEKSYKEAPRPQQRVREKNRLPEPQELLID